MKFSPGQAVPRTEDFRLLTGKGRYADDVTLPGQTYAAMVRSPHPHARINGVDPSAALGMPGVLAVLTARDWDADGLGELVFPGHFLPQPLRRPDGRDFVNARRPPLPRDKVRFLGEAVAMVIARTPALAADAAEGVEVDYEPLEATVHTDAANADGAPLVWDDHPRNEVFVHSAGDAAATDEAFRTAPHVVSQRLVVNRVHANPMEPRSFNGWYDPDRDHYTIYGGVHRPFAARDMFAKDVFHVDAGRIDIVPGDLGGSFGLRGAILVEMVLVAWASRRVGHPVKWTGTRGEMLIADDHGRDVVNDAEIAFDREGRILGLRVRCLNNIGAYMSYYGAASAVHNIGSLAGTYTIPAMHVEVTGVWTNTSSLSPYRGAGRPEAAYVIERMIDLAAAELAMDPAEMRRRNLIPNDAFPYKTALTFTYDCGEFDQVLAKALAAADYDGFPARRADSARRGRLRGIGIAMTIEVASAPGVENVGLKFAADGSVTVLAGTTNHGQGHETFYTQFVVDRLGLEPGAVSVVESDTRVMDAGSGTGGSRSAAFGSAAILDGIGRCIARGRPIAARLLQAGEEEVAFEEAAYRVRGTGRSVPFVDVVRAAFDPETLPPGAEPGFHEVGRVSLTLPNFPNGCQVCEVEITPAFGTVDIVRHTVCDDVGFELNPLTVKGQLQGGVVQGVGQALMEAVVFDDEGQNLTGSFMDYAMPRASDVGAITVLSHPVPTATNPMGVKGVGESGTVGGLPAVMNAIANALAPLGVKHLDMPATPQSVWRAIREAPARA